MKMIRKLPAPKRRAAEALALRYFRQQIVVDKRKKLARNWCRKSR